MNPVEVEPGVTLERLDINYKPMYYVRSEGGCSTYMSGDIDSIKLHLSRVCQQPPTRAFWVALRLLKGWG